MKVEVVSKEIIKPFYPTPHQNRTFHLSFLDQLAPLIHVPLILFYEIDGDDGIEGTSMTSRFNLLKKSLSDTLTRFYPLAGRMIKDDDSIVECNDYGVELLEAKVTTTNNVKGGLCGLSELIQHPDVHLLLNQFLPFDPYSSLSSSESCNISDKPLLAIQVNVFDCGGIVIGLCISHKLADGASFVTFVNDWAATARGSPPEQIKGPCFDLPILFPKRDLMGFVAPTGISTTSTSPDDYDVQDLTVTKKFGFNDSKIAQLKKRSTKAACGGAYPTRVEAMSAFIWKRFMDLDQAKEGAAAARVYAAFHTVNMRTRIVPPLPTNSLGNMYGTAVATVVQSNDDDYPGLVGKIKDAIKKIDGEHVRNLQTTDALLDSAKTLEGGISSGQMLYFSSWCRFPIYEADFGWGKPIWVSVASLPFKNLVVFMDTRSGDGMEVWVNMTKEDMAKFERDEELLAFVS